VEMLVARARLAGVAWRRMVSFECWGRLGVVAVAVAMVGCRPDQPGRVSVGRYDSTSYGLAVTGDASDPESPAAGLMPIGWKLDNFRGSPLPDEPKTGDSYKTKYRFDRDNDGDLDLFFEESAFQLRFKSLQDAGVVWLRTIPVSEDLSETQLSTLMSGLVDSLAGGEYESVALSAKRVLTVEKRYAATLVSALPCRLAEHECLVGTIELADVDQLRMTPGHRSQKMELVLSRSPFRYEERRTRTTFPVYILVGYANQPSDFDKSLPAFRDLLSRIEIVNRRGFSTLASTAPSTAPEPSAPTPASPPAAGGTVPTPPPPESAPSH
jgi:hypothetical protein